MGASIAVGPSHLEADLRQLPGAEDKERLHPRQRYLQGAGDNIELTLAPGRNGHGDPPPGLPQRGTHGRLQGGHGIGAAIDTVPDTVADEQPGRTKYGFGMNIEQPLANDGETGLFARLGWAERHELHLVLHRGGPPRQHGAPGERPQLGAQRRRLRLGVAVERASRARTGTISPKGASACS